LFVDLYRRLLTPVEALLTTDAVTSLQDHLRHHHQRQQQQHDDVTDTSDTASSIDDAASEMSDEEAASVIEVEVARTDHWSNTDRGQLTTGHSASNSIPTPDEFVPVHWSGPPTSSSSLPSNSPDDALLRNRIEYIQTAPWRCLPIRHRASISDPDIASSSAAVSDFERQRLARARERRHLARSVDVAPAVQSPSSSSSSSSSSSVLHVQTAPVATTTVNNNNKQQRQVSRSSYVPQKPPPPLPMPENELVKQLRPVQTNDVTTKPSSSATSSSSSSSAREQQRPVRELVAQLTGQMPYHATTTTQLPPPPQQQQQQQQLRRQQRRHQLQQLHGRPLSSSSSDAEADYEIFINTPPAAASRADGDSNDNSSVRSLVCLFSRTSELSFS